MRVIIINIQQEKPMRTCNKTYANYTSFKPYLREDFNKRCGYCDDLDFYAGGRRGYHIDHFKPHSITRFAALMQTYSNLVYSCPFCNGGKSNKWEDINGFIDPCEDEYDDHIYRNDKGKIEYKTYQGKYIFENLKLGLIRHELLWCIGKLEAQRDEISSKIDAYGNDHKRELDLLHAFRRIQNKISEYTGLLREKI